MKDVILKIRRLTLGYNNNVFPLIRNMNFELKRGEILCLHGASGSGKSTVIWAVMGKLNEIGGYAEGEILLDEKDILNVPYYMKAARWEKIALVPQSSMSAFNPVYRIEKTYLELLNIKRRNMQKREKQELIREMLEVVQLKKTVLKQFPYELSGGMRQRAAIALALLLDPEILILDEATTGLDVLVEANILWTLKKIHEQRSMSMLVVSHDARIADSLCDRRISL